MTTYLLLALHDDGRSEAFAFPQAAVLDARDVLQRLSAAASGNDRGIYRTYESSGYSIDVQYNGTKRAERQLCATKRNTEKH